MCSPNTSSNGEFSQFSLSSVVISRQRPPFGLCMGMTASAAATLLLLHKHQSSFRSFLQMWSPENHLRSNKLRAPSMRVLTSRASLHQFTGWMRSQDTMFGCHSPIPCFTINRFGLLSYLQCWCAWYSRPPPPEFPAVVCGSLRYPLP